MNNKGVRFSEGLVKVLVKAFLREMKAMKDLRVYRPFLFKKVYISWVGVKHSGSENDIQYKTAEETNLPPDHHWIHDVFMRQLTSFFKKLYVPKDEIQKEDK